MIDRSKPIWEITYKIKIDKDSPYRHASNISKLDVLGKNKTEAITKAKKLIKSFAAGHVRHDAYAFSAKISPRWESICKEEDAWVAKIRKQRGQNKTIRSK